MEIAETYRVALRDDPRHATRHVAEKYYMTSKTARQWIKLARAAKVTDEATQGKAGEQPANDQEGDDHAD